MVIGNLLSAILEPLVILDFLGKIQKFSIFQYLLTKLKENKRNVGASPVSLLFAVFFCTQTKPNVPRQLLPGAFSFYHPHLRQ